LSTGKGKTSQSGKRANFPVGTRKWEFGRLSEVGKYNLIGGRSKTMLYRKASGKNSKP